jgi:hypothetical protein
MLNPATSPIEDTTSAMVTVKYRVRTLGSHFMGLTSVRVSANCRPRRRRIREKL